MNERNYRRGGKRRPAQRFALKEGAKSYRNERRRTETHEEEKRSDDGTMRLNRYIANSGVCSRRDAEKLILNGEITINGKVVTALGTRVSKSDKVAHNGVLLNPEERVYILLNKPKNTVSTASDPEGRRTVLDIVENACDERINKDN